MKHNIAYKTLIVLLAVLALTGFGIYYFFFSMSSLPHGTFICESTSPQGTYTVAFYETSPALSVGGTRGEAINNNTGSRRNLYWEYNRNLPEKGIADTEISWESDEIVIINGVRLNIKRDTYDYRRK